MSETARRVIREATRHVNNEREMVGRALGGGEHLAENHEIDDGDATVIAAAHHEVQLLATELGVGVSR